MLHFKDLLALLRNPGPIDPVELAREPRYVMETTPVLKVLDELRASRDHMLIVVDEHGVCEGLVTPMDVLTAVAGELPEHAEAPPEALQLSDGSWLLDGRLALAEAARLLDAAELADDADDATLAGLLLRAEGRIPETGDVVAWRDWRFEVTRRDGLRIDQSMRARRPTPPPLPARPDRGLPPPMVYIALRECRGGIPVFSRRRPATHSFQSGWAAA